MNVILLTWTGFLLTVLLGHCVFPWVYTMHRGGYFKRLANEHEVFRQKKQRFLLRRVNSTSPQMVWCYLQAVREWLTFYLTLFVILPVLLIFGIMFATFANASLEGVKFVEEERFSATDILFWLGIYYFATMPISTLLMTLQSIDVKYEQLRLSEKLPLNYAKRLHWELGFFGSFFFTTGCVVHILESNDVNPNIEFICVLVPLLMAVKVCFNGVTLVANLLYLTVIPFYVEVWYLGHVALGFYFFYLVATLNLAAGTVLIFTWSVIWLGSWVLWLSGVKKCKVTNSERIDFERVFSSNSNMIRDCTDMNFQQSSSLTLKVISNNHFPVSLSGKVWFFRSRWLRMVPSYISKTPTEDDINFHIRVFKDTDSTHFAATPLLVPPYVFGGLFKCVSYCFGNIPLSWFECLYLCIVGTQYHNLSKEASWSSTNLGSVWVFPSLGRPLQNFIDPSKQTICIANANGINSALSHYFFCHPLELNIKYVFFCKSLFELMKVYSNMLHFARGRDDIALNLYHLDEVPKDLLIFYTGRDLGVKTLQQQAVEFQYQHNRYFSYQAQDDYTRIQAFIDAVVFAPGSNVTDFALGKCVDVDIETIAICFGDSCFVAEARYAIKEKLKENVDIQVQVNESSILDRSFGYPFKHPTYGFHDVVDNDNILEGFLTSHGWLVPDDVDVDLAAGTN